MIDGEADEPVNGASVVLLNAKGISVWTAVTDSSGRFVLQAPGPGRYLLRVEHVAYLSVTSPPFDLVSEEPLDVELRTSAIAIPLAPLTIMAERPALLSDLRLGRTGFYERRASWGEEGMGFGRFLDREDIDRHSSARLSDVLRDLPGVFVVGAGGRDQVVRMRSATSMFGGRCAPMIYLDGHPVRFGGSIDDLISAESLAAIEVSPGITKPGEFGAMLEHPCGAIVLWTG